MDIYFSHCAWNQRQRHVRVKIDIPKKGMNMFKMHISICTTGNVIQWPYDSLKCSYRSLHESNHPFPGFIGFWNPLTLIYENTRNIMRSFFRLNFSRSQISIFDQRSNCRHSWQHTFVICLFSRFFFGQKLISEKQQLDRKGNTGATWDGITRCGLAKKKVWFWKRFWQWLCFSLILVEMSGIVLKQFPKASLWDQLVFIWPFVQSNYPTGSCVQSIMRNSARMMYRTPPSLGTGSSKRCFGQWPLRSSDTQFMQEILHQFISCLSHGFKCFCSMFFYTSI